MSELDYLVEKAFRFRAPFRRVADPKTPLGPGEYWHGTSRESAEKIRREGFKLVDPRSPNHRGIDATYRGDPSTPKHLRRDFTINPADPHRHSTRTKAGRPRATGDLGPGVYGTDNHAVASIYANEMSGSKGAKSWPWLHPDAEVMRFRVDGPITEGSVWPMKTPQASKKGFAGTGRMVMSNSHIYREAAVNPHRVTVVDTPKVWAPNWSPTAYMATAAVPIGGAQWREVSVIRRRRREASRSPQMVGKALGGGSKVDETKERLVLDGRMRPVAELRSLRDNERHDRRLSRGMAVGSGLLGAGGAAKFGMREFGIARDPALSSFYNHPVRLSRELNPAAGRLARGRFVARAAGLRAGIHARDGLALAGAAGLGLGAKRLSDHSREAGRHADSLEAALRRRHAERLFSM